MKESRQNDQPSKFSALLRGIIFQTLYLSTLFPLLLVVFAIIISIVDSIGLMHISGTPKVLVQLLISVVIVLGVVLAPIVFASFQRYQNQCTPKLYFYLGSLIVSIFGVAIFFLIAAQS